MAQQRDIFSIAQYLFCEPSRMRVDGRAAFIAFSLGRDTLFNMRKLLEEAIEQLRELPEDQQDAAADVLFAYISSDEREYQLRADQAETVRRVRRDLRAGKTRLATDHEVTALRNKSHL